MDCRLSAEQQDIEDAGLLAAPASAVLCVPTGFGKTFLSRRAIRNAQAAGYRAVYLCPLRALARELYADWRKDIAGLGVYTGETGIDEADDIPLPSQAQVMICTPEKFDAYLRQWQSNLDWIAQVDLLVVDELHLLGEPHRGPTLEGLIARLRIINPFVRVLGLSATLGNPEQLAAWLGAQLYRSSQRPVPLTWRIETFDAKGSGAEGKAEIAIGEVRQTAAEQGQTIVFCQSRPRTEGLALAMRQAGLRAEAHHAGLPPKKRHHVEQQFRSGVLDAVIATPTLALGVNLPARKVVIHDLQRFAAGEWQDLSVTEIWQLGGRAGRRGLDASGEVVLISPRHNQKAARRYVAGRFEPVHSAMTQVHKLAEQILVLFGSRLCKTREQVVRLLDFYLFGRQPATHLGAAVERTIGKMLQAGMLEEDESGIRATRLGRIAVRHQLSPETVLCWHDFAADCKEAGKTPTFMDILVVVAGASDFNGRLRCDADDLAWLAESLNAEAMVLKDLSILDWSPQYVPSTGRTLISAIKSALALRAWTRLGDLEEAAAASDAQSHDLDEARKEMVRMLAAFRDMLLLNENLEPEVAEKSQGDMAGLPERVLALAAMIATGMTEQNASLSLVSGIGPVLARRLVAQGVEDIEDLAQACPEDLVVMGGLSLRRAQAWIDDATGILGSGGAYRYRELRAETAQLCAGDGIDYYRWRRAADLQVRWISDQRALVTGGAAPHQLVLDSGRWACDCADAAQGHVCKHAIAVRHAQHDASIPRFDGPFQTGAQAVSLWAVWNDAGRRVSWR